MKKVLIGVLASYLVYMLVIFIMVGQVGGSSSGTVLPIFYTITEEDARDYQKVCIPLSVPWEIPILIDALEACEHNEMDMQRYSSRFTALHFCTLIEEKYVSKEVPADSEEAKMHQSKLELVSLDIFESYFDQEGGSGIKPTPPHKEPVPTAKPEENIPQPTEEPTHEPTEEPTPEPTEEPMVKIWVLDEIKRYDGKDAILGYIKSIECESMDTIHNAVSQAAGEKSSEEILYRSRIEGLEIADYKKFLEELQLGKYIDIQCIMDIYMDGYLVDLYGDGNVYYLPEPTPLQTPGFASEGEG